MKASTTAQRLNKLADAIEKARKGTFDHASLHACIIGLGVRLNPDGTFVRRTRPSGDYNNYVVFKQKFGLPQREMSALNYGAYSELGIGMDDLTTLGTDANEAVEVLRRLAARYATEG